METRMPRGEDVKRSRKTRQKTNKRSTRHREKRTIESSKLLFIIIEWMSVFYLEVSGRLTGRTP